MASLETLPPDQRAVLDLVLQRGRSYDDIAHLLAIDRSAVRSRALAALDQLGPETGLLPESRALITDYLLGQLPERVAEQTRERLAESSAERAWARVLASELGSLASKALPEIPGETRPAVAAMDAGSRDGTIRRAPRRSDRPSSRRGGAIMLAVGTLIVIGIVVVLAATTGSSKHHTPTSAASSTRAATSASNPSSAGASATTTSGAQLTAQINLNPPSGTGSAKGIAFVVKEGAAYGIIIQAQHVAPNSHNAYAAWLSNSPTHSVRLGFVSPGIGKTGQLQTGGPLPTTAGRYKELLLTLETTADPTTPGTIVLEGPFKGVP